MFLILTNVETEMKNSAILIILFMFAVACSNEKSFENKVDTIFSEFDKNNSPGVAIAIKQNGKLIYQKEFGLADLGKQKKIEAQTNFRLASITKQFTAMSILILENDGKLILEDKITKYFPELNKYASDISIKNILQHTSGLPDYESLAGKQDTAQLRDKDVLEILSKQDSLYFIPSSKHQYSNSGYAILALLIERLSGLSFAEFLDLRIFTPLKMNNTVAYENGISTVSNRAFGYTKTEFGFVDSDQSKYSAVLGDGGIYSSINDLIKWDNEIINPTLLPKEKFDMIFVKGKTNTNEEFDYGFGWRLDPYKNFERHYHTGGTSGFTNIYMKVPELDITVIVLINLYDYNAKGYAEKIVELLVE